MNLGNIKNKATQPSRLYALLKGAAVRGDWLSTRDISHAINSMAASTIISQVREQLGAGEYIEKERHYLGGQAVWRYRLRTQPGQAELFATEPAPAQPWTGEVA